MIVALIGLFGVAAGALLGGIVSITLERRKQNELGRAARILIAGELKVVERRMRSANKDTWWGGELPTAAWRAHMSELALTLSPAQLDKLTGAYTLVETWNTERASQSITEHRLSEVLRDAQELVEIQGSLTGTPSKSVAVRSLRSARRWSLLMAAALVVAILAIAAFVPHVDVNSESVADSLQSDLGTNVLVTCNPAEADWFCTEYHLAESRQACLNENTSTLAVIRAITVVASGTTQCAVTAPPTDDIVSSDSGHLVITPLQAERAQARIDIHPAPEPKVNFLSKFWNWATGAQ